MKDLPHHIKKLNRKVIRSMHREEMEGETLPEVPTWPMTEKERRKKEKMQMRDETLDRPSFDLPPEERNKIMKEGRVPVFDRINNAKPKHTRPSKKKTPRI